jgi:drug/metabolite transporter (DMT)-like permease
MPRMLLWAIPGIFVWGVLQFLAAKFCSGWREERVKYGFVALGCLAWWLPNLAVGETGASEVEQVVLIAGFPIAAFYLAYLVVGEWWDRRMLKDWKAKSDSEKLTIGWKGNES